ncbi:MAG TPA: hypothetical protein DDW50_02690 [Firmicutes bacterium]|nr:hypothetical protein [Bacillota bacterium]
MRLFGSSIYFINRYQVVRCDFSRFAIFSSSIICPTAPSQAKQRFMGDVGLVGVIQKNGTMVPMVIFQD